MVSKFRTKYLYELKKDIFKYYICNYENIYDFMYASFKQCNKV